MPLAKFNRKKIIHWLSPLLVLSLGIHGLALLIPISEKPEPEEEPKPEVLEPIQVSTLPPLPEAATEQPTIAEPPDSAELVVPAPAQIAQSVPAASQPVPAAPQPVRPNMPSPQTSPNSTTPGSTAAPIPKPSKLPPAPPLPYNPAGTTEREARNETIVFINAYGGNLPSKVDTPLELVYPAGGDCIDPASPEASVAVAVNSGGGIIDGKVVKSSGRDKVNQWIEDTVLASELPSYAFADPANASGKTTADWIYEVFAGPAGVPLVPEGVNEAVYLIDVTVTVENNNC